MFILVCQRMFIYIDHSIHIFRIVQKRTQAVEREINKKYADDKKMSRKEKEVGYHPIYVSTDPKKLKNTVLRIFFVYLTSITEFLKSVPGILLCLRV